APTYGQALTVTATMAGSGTQIPGILPPSGTVTFSVDDGTPSAPVTLTGGQATFALGTLSVGKHKVRVASYSGDANYTKSTYAATTDIVVTVGQATSSLALAANPANG